MYRYNHLVWDSPLDKSEKLILLYLLHLANDQGICWPSLSTIGEKTDMTRQGVIKVLDRLRSLGIVEWHVEEDVKRRVYRVYPERLADLDKTKVVNDVDQVVNGVDQVVNDVDQGGQLGLPAWSTGFTGVVNPVDPTYPIDLSIDLKTTTTTTPSSATPHKAQGGDGGGGGEEKTSALNREPGQSPFEALPAAREDFHKSAVMAAWEARLPDRLPPPPHTEDGALAVRALREAGLWERFKSLRRFATDRRAWDEWLHGPVARHFRRLGATAFVRAVEQALEGLASRPDLNRPILWFERQLERVTPPPAPAVEAAKDPLEYLIEAIVAEDREAATTWAGR